VHEVDPEPDWGWVAEDTGWVPPVLDAGRPSLARIRDCLLAGKDNLAVDRAVVADLMAGVPDVDAAAQADRTFLVEAVHAMAGAGIGQFLHLWCGLPRDRNVHDVARSRDPDAVIGYVDSDPVVLAHLRALVGTDARIAVCDRDPRDPQQVLADPRLRAVLDLGAPVGVLLVDALSFLDHASAPAVVAGYARALPAGSRIAISVASQDDVAAAAIHTMHRVYAEAGAPIYPRTRAQVEQLFDGLRLLPPGLSDLYHSPTACTQAGIGVKDSPTTRAS
jgi:hypothetical protein